MATLRVNFWNDRLDGGTDDDTLLGDWRGNVMLGNGGNDTLAGDGGDDRLGGGSGNDELHGEDGNDRLSGGDNNDVLDGGNNDDLLAGEDGDDTIHANSGVDVVIGGSGNDIIDVTGGDWRFDRVDGGSGNDTITVEGSKVILGGGSGNDTITTDLAKEQLLIGNSGSDRFAVTQLVHHTGQLANIFGGDATFTLSGGLFDETLTGTTAGSDSSIDTLDLSALTGMSTSLTNPDLGYVHRAIVDLSQDYLGHEQGPVGFGETYFSGSLNIAGEGGVAFDASDVSVRQVARLTGIENVVGSGGADFIIGSAVANDLRGSGGEDVIGGGDGNDFLDGGANNDFLSGGAGVDTIRGGAGVDTIFGDDAAGGVFADRLTGGADADHFVFVDVGTTLQFQTVPGSNLHQGGSQFQFVEVSVFDTITDFDTRGVDRDTIHLSSIFERSMMGDLNARQAIEQGFLYFVQHVIESEPFLGNPLGQDTFATQVMVDLNGGAHNDAENNFIVADLLGVRQTSLNSEHFVV